MLWLGGAVLLWYLAFYVLLPVPAVRPGRDESWRALLVWAFEHGRQFGSEVIFTYGPWGFLLEPRGTASAYAWLVLGRLVLAAAAAAGIALLGASWIRPAMWRSVWAAAIVVLAEPALLAPVLLFLVALPSVTESRWKGPVIALIAFAAGLAACTKFTCFLMVAALMLLMALRKSLRTIVPITAASFLLFWLVAGQKVSNIPEFVRQSLEVANGYRSAMVSGRPSIELLLTLLVCALPLLQTARQTMPPVTLERIACLAWLAAYEFLIFRHSLIRSDDFHLDLALLSVGIPIGVLLIPLPGGAASGWPPWWRAVYGIVVVVAFAGTLSLSRGAALQRARVFLQSLKQYRVYAQQFPSLRGPQHALSAGAGSVDVFADELSYAISNGLQLRNRPALQSYAAYTKRLCEKDAAFLEGPDAPETVYFHVHAVDNRYPTMEDSLAWRSLLTHYAPESVENGYLVLKRRQQAAEFELKPVLDRAIRTDERLDIPEVPGGLVWAEIQVQRTLGGRLLDLLYRNEKMDLQVETGRRLLDFRLLDETAAVGFLLSPLVSTQASMLEVFEPEPLRLSAENVRRILVRRGRAASLGFGRDVRIRLYALLLKTAVKDVPGGLVQELGRTLRAERSVGSAEFTPAVTLTGNEVRLLVGSPSSGWIPRQSGRSVHLRYGIEGLHSTCSGAVSFRILLASGASGEKRLLWEDPRLGEVGKGWSAESTVQLPAASGQQRIYFETESPEASCGVEGAYWSELRIEPESEAPPAK